MEKYQPIYNVLKQGNLSQLCNLANKLKVSHETPGITFYDNKKEIIIVRIIDYFNKNNMITSYNRRKFTSEICDNC